MILRLFVIFLFFIPNANANNKEKIVTNLKNTSNLSFKFEQNINGKIEIGNCTIEYPKKMYCSYEKNNKVLVIGDSLENDIKGANNLKFDSLLITDGIHREVNNNNDVDKQKLDALIKTKNIFPDFYMRKLT